jgi:hypothetical protein
MPFTVSHTLAAMPFVYARRLRLDPTCLVIGTMSPDFESFARVKVVSNIGHTLPGLVIWCLPMTLLCAWLFHRVMKWPLLRVAPRVLAERLAPGAERLWMPEWTPGALAIVVLSAIIGACTHIAWDSFTHGGMWGTDHVAALREIHTVPLIGLMPAHRILQYGFSLVALIVLAVLAARSLRRVDPVPVETGGRLLWFSIVVIATGLAYARMFANHETDIGSLVVAPMSGLIYGSLTAAIVSRSISSPRRSSAT